MLIPIILLSCIVRNKAYPKMIPCNCKLKQKYSKDISSGPSEGFTYIEYMLNKECLDTFKNIIYLKNKNAKYPWETNFDSVKEDEGIAMIFNYNMSVMHNNVSKRLKLLQEKLQKKEIFYILDSYGSGAKLYLVDTSSLMYYYINSDVY